jgi:hypothetical protein
MEPKLTTTRAAWILIAYLSSWAFCLYVGWQMGAVWGVLALALFEARHLNAVRAGRRYLLRDMGHDR